MVHYTDEQIKINLSDYLSQKLNYTTHTWQIFSLKLKVPPLTVLPFTENRKGKRAVGLW